MQYRQGDVFIELVTEIPTTAKLKKDKDRLVLAYGEVTGHAHVVVDDDVRSFVDGDGGLYLDVPVETAVKHQEHSDIPLPAGIYRITHQREYSPEEIRNVAD